MILQLVTKTIVQKVALSLPSTVGDIGENWLQKSVFSGAIAVPRPSYPLEGGMNERQTRCAPRAVADHGS